VLRFLSARRVSFACLSRRKPMLCEADTRSPVTAALLPCVRFGPAGSHVTRPLFPLTPFPSVCITRRDGEDTRFDRPSRTWPLRFPGPPPLTDRVDISVEGSFFLFFFTILLDLALLFFLAEVAPGVTVICCYRNRTKRSGITNSTTCKGHKKMHPRNVPYSPCPQQ
jgi:hypothetical protein